jgi:hypothetical protein
VSSKCFQLCRVIQMSRNPWGKRTISWPNFIKVPVSWESFLNDFLGDSSKRALISSKLSLLRTEGRPDDVSHQYSRFHGNARRDVEL